MNEYFLAFNQGLSKQLNIVFVPDHTLTSPRPRPPAPSAYQVWLSRVTVSLTASLLPLPPVVTGTT